MNSVPATDFLPLAQPAPQMVLISFSQSNLSIMSKLPWAIGPTFPTQSEQPGSFRN